MKEILNQKEQDINHCMNTIDPDIIEEYARSDKRMRDYMWMKYRIFRNQFDEIEKVKLSL
ncbi:MAG: hypothetical protein GY857_02750 [Desulfobacula sp.]|nr:hypothetical protein [Desulfobacula sp.]